MTDDDWNRYKRRYSHLEGIDCQRTAKRHIVDVHSSLDSADLLCAMKEERGEAEVVPATGSSNNTKNIQQLQD